MTTDTIERPILIETGNTPEIATLDIYGIELTRDEIGDPAAFLSSDRGKEWMKPILSGAYFTRYYDHNRGPIDLKTCNEIAGKVLEAKRRGECPETVLEEHFGFGQDPEDVYDEEHAADVAAKVEELAREIEDLEDDTLPELDEEAWCEAIRDRVIEHMSDEDDSSVLDMIGSFDRFELVVRLDPNYNYICSNGNGPDFDRLCIDQALRNHLARLGYTIADYRRMTRNRARGERTSRQVPVRTQPLLTETELRSLIEESCGYSSAIVLYAAVSLPQLIDLDLARPVVLSRCAIASYNSMNGTFFDTDHEQAIILDPRYDRLTEAWGYRPEDICGLHMPAYHADMANAG